LMSNHLSENWLFYLNLVLIFLAKIEVNSSHFCSTKSLMMCEPYCLVIFRHPSEKW
jgi:hypothetical protein